MLGNLFAKNKILFGWNICDIQTINWIKTNNNERSCVAFDTCHTTVLEDNQPKIITANNWLLLFWCSPVVFVCQEIKKIIATQSDFVNKKKTERFL